MKKCNDECIPCCDFCVHVIHDEVEFVDGVTFTSPIGCNKWDDDFHQELAESCSYCEDFHCFNCKD